MSKQQKKSSGFPLAIIALVFIVVVIGGIWFYSTSKRGTSTTSNTTGTNSSTLGRSSIVPSNAPSGAPLGVNVMGNPSAAVTVEEFADYQCGGCAGVHPVMKELQSAYAGNKNFRFIYRHLPLAIPAHDKSFDASVATEAAGMQGKFWQMQDLLFRNQQAWTSAPNYRELWEGYATSIGLDVEKWKSDMAGMATRGRVEADMNRARALNITSTPTLLVNGKPIPMPEMTIASLRRIIDAEIQQATAAQSNSAAPASSAPAANGNAANR
ncbi:MAG: thioredoxin domain-containing protein [Pyrinomonadaceae bacterium]|nr:thioredoxin domain-containing protein [Pyrinomonadaceae bacterium]